MARWMVVAGVGGCWRRGRRRSPRLGRGVGSFLAGGEAWGACRRVPVRLGWFAGRGRELVLPEATIRNIQFMQERSSVISKNSPNGGSNSAELGRVGWRRCVFWAFLGVSYIGHYGYIKFWRYSSSRFFFVMSHIGILGWVVVGVGCCGCQRTYRRWRALAAVAGGRLWPGGGRLVEGVVGVCWLAWSWRAADASPGARRWDFLSRWRGRGSVSAGVRGSWLGVSLLFFGNRLISGVLLDMVCRILKLIVNRVLYQER